VISSEVKVLRQTVVEEGISNEENEDIRADGVDGVLITDEKYENVVDSSEDLPSDNNVKEEETSPLLE